MQGLRSLNKLYSRSQTSSGLLSVMSELIWSQLAKTQGLTQSN